MESTGLTTTFPLALAMHSHELRARAEHALGVVAQSDSTLAEALRTAAKHTSLVVASDFDGTLCEHVLLPALPKVDDLGARAFARLAALPRVVGAIVSGRGLNDLTHALSAKEHELARCVLVGSHGAEWSDAGTHDSSSAQEKHTLVTDPSTQQTVRALRDAMHALLSGELAPHASGVFVEHKPLGVAVHVRGLDAPIGQSVLVRAQRAMLACGDVRMRMGAMVVEASVAKVGKDDAIRALRARMASAADAKHVCVVALGDDVTDEDAFGALEAHDVGIKVGTGPTLARYRVASVARVCEALWALALLREASCDELQVGSITDR